MEDILEPIRMAGVTLWLDRGQLRSRTPLADLPADIAKYLQSKEPELIALLRDREQQAFGPTPKLIAGEATGRYKMSFLQEMSVVLYAPASVRTFNLVSGLQILGKLRANLLVECVRYLTRRHEILRASIARDELGNSSMFIRDNVDVELHPLEVDNGDYLTSANAFGAELFNLESGPLFRVGLSKLGHEKHLLVLVFHHAIADGWSLALAWMEIVRLYNALVVSGSLHQPCAPLPIQFTDVMRYRQAWLESEPAYQARAYWKQRLIGSSDPFALPYDRVSAIPEVSPLPISGSLDDEDSKSILALCKVEKISLSTLALAAFAIVLARWTRRSDIVTWVTHAGRRRREVLRLIGCFFDTWLLRVDITETMTLIDAIRVVNRSVASAMSTLDLPGAEMLNQFTSVRGQDLKRIIMFNFMRSAADAAEQYSRSLSASDIENGALTGSALELASAGGHFEAGSIMALYLSMFGSDQSMRWSFRHHPECFEDSSIRQVSRALHDVLHLAATKPLTPISECTVQ